MHEDKVESNRAQHAISDVRLSLLRQELAGCLRCHEGVGFFFLFACFCFFFV